MSTTSRRLEKYDLQQQLGRGSIGEVWKAQHTELHRDAVIKILHSDLQSDPHFLTRFTTEGQYLTSLQHANIVPLREVNIWRSPETNETVAYLVTDYIEGRTFYDYLQTTSHRGKFPSVSQIVYLFTSLGVAIDYAHQKGVVHGNIKPANILLNQKDTSQFEAGEPMLSDFGFPRLLGYALNPGSPLYMSPEQAQGQAPNNRSDVYALGVILYEICTGVQPFRDESSVAVMMQHINTLPTPPILINPNIPPALSEVILRAMAKDTATRFPMASLLAAAIADACSLPTTIPISLNNIGALHDEETAAPQTSILGVAQTRPTPMPRMLASKPPQPMSTPTPSQPAVAQQQTGKTPTPAPQTYKLPVAPVTTKIAVPPSTTTAKQAVQENALSPLPLPPPPQKQVPTLRATSNAVLPTRSIPRKRSNLTDTPVYMTIIALVLLLVVVGAAIGVNLVLKSQEDTKQTGLTASPLAGHVYFQDDALGHSSTLRIQMQNVSLPAQGKSYFAWLQDTTGQYLPLGRLAIKNGTISYLYPGDSKHTNLLGFTRNIVITVEESNNTPQIPSSEVAYLAEFNTKTFPHIKNILYSTPELPNKQSVIVNLFETIKSINDKAGSIVDSLQGTHDYGLAHRQAIRIVELIDGTDYARSSGDLPKKEPSLTKTSVGLITSPQQKGYLDLLAQHLAQLKQASGNQETLLQHIQNVENAITDLKDWVQKMRSNAVHIVKAADLTDPAIIGVALQLKKAAADSYTGRTIPPNEGPQPVLGSAGAYQAYIECQYLATLDLKKT
jgi:serine/threonine protein kinase